MIPTNQFKMKEKIQENKVPLIVGVLVLAVVLFYIYQDKLAKFFLYRGETSTGAVNTGAVTVSSPSNSSNTGSTVATATNDTVLKKGSSGTKVKELQILMNKAVESKSQYAPLATDGVFGAATELRLYELTLKRSISINQFKTYI